MLGMDFCTRRHGHHSFFGVAGSWTGWVQERGLYFLGEKDSRYVDLLSMTDSFKDNPGEKLGAMVEASYGRGKWISVRAVSLIEALLRGQRGRWPVTPQRK